MAKCVWLSGRLALSGDLWFVHSLALCFWSVFSLVSLSQCWQTSQPMNLSNLSIVFTLIDCHCHCLCLQGVCLSVCLLVDLCPSLSVCAYLSAVHVSLPVFLFVCEGLCLFVCDWFCLSVCLSVCLWLSVLFCHCLSVSCPWHLFEYLGAGHNCFCRPECTHSIFARMHTLQWIRLSLVSQDYWSES